MNLPNIQLKHRRPDWDVQLMAWADGCLGLPFEWNQTNCAALVAAALDAMHGTDLFAWQAQLRLSDSRAMTLSAARKTREVLLHIGCATVDPPYAQRGDILLAFDSGVECAHVSLGLHAISSSLERGVHFVTTESVLLAASDLEVFRCP